MVTAVCNSKDILYPPNGHLVAIMGLHAPARGLLITHPGDGTLCWALGPALFWPLHLGSVLKRWIPCMGSYALFFWSAECGVCVCVLHRQPAVLSLERG